MKKYIFGFDADHPENCARRLKAQGMDAVVVGDADERTEDALANAGLELYLCFGAYGLPAAAPATAHTASGRPIRWFSSGCPNDTRPARRRLQNALDLARRLKTVRGILVDGARFASFASAEGTDAFFSCFCPRCMDRMQAMGLNAKGVRAAAARLMARRQVTDADAPYLSDWLSFRAACVQAYMDDFAAKTHALRSGLLAGAFVFAPSLAGYVGQTSDACRALDIVAPMLYRAYPHEEGPACMGHEWAAMKTVFGGQTRAFAQLAAPECFFPDASAEALLTDGFAPAAVGGEVARAHAGLRPGQQLWPILQIEDDRLSETTACASDNGADAVGYFMFGQAELP